MKSFQWMKWLAVAVFSVACIGLFGCGSDDDDSPSTLTTVVTTNVVNGVVVTNVVAVEDAIGEEVAEPVAEPVEALDEPVSPTVTGTWIGEYTGPGVNALLNLTLTQNGEAVSGTYAFSDAGSGAITSGQISSDNFLFMGIKRNENRILLGGRVDFNARTFSGEWKEFVRNEDTVIAGTFSLR